MLAKAAYKAMEDIEMVASLHSNSNREELQDEKERRQRIVHLQSFAMFFITGMNDGNLGVILPSIRAHYGLSQSMSPYYFFARPRVIS